MRTDPFLAPEAPPVSQADRRGAPRYAVSVTVEVVTADGVPLFADMTNVSLSGFRARSPMIMPKGTKLIVRFNGKVPRRARVAWQEGEEIGCSFMQPLSNQQLASLTGRQAA